MPILVLLWLRRLEPPVKSGGDGRHIMKNKAWFAVIAGVFFIACAAFVPAGERVLHIYTWSDYFDPDVIAAFEDRYDCRVSIDYFDSNEAMYAKIKAGAGGYDLITPSSYMSAVMRKQDLLVPMDHSLLPNLVNMDRAFTALTEDPELAYSVPYTRTVSGVGYNRERLGEVVEKSWGIFARDDLSRRMTMLNDLRETIGAALKHLGYSLNTTNEEELEEAGKLLLGWKRNLAKFEVDEAKIGLGSGEFHVIHGYNGDVALIMEENEGIGFFVPEEGSSLASDDFVILKGAANPELSHAFINYMLDPEVALRNMEGIFYYMPNPAAVEMLDSGFRDSPAFALPDAVLAKCEVIRDLGADNALYVKIWDMVKAEE
ncbi:MAG: spermidine/putrescine ABC transporter substrate-binding protein [Planctomycetota bacterium]|jgi:spermidine/putrescine transport system substrate-binding protein|nr:spermidine/putrescine ABC transporter substrate-binding protein [Planctomycetota bacterium]